MSLVGTRPPTVDEWEQYELHHRSRMSTKPGITGMWQVSGRSDITDFEEVVRLDTEYIENGVVESLQNMKVPGAGYLYPVFLRFGLIRRKGESDGHLSDMDNIQ